MLSLGHFPFGHLPEDVDKALLLIRNELPKHINIDDPACSFYNEKLIAWKTGEVETGGNGEKKEPDGNIPVVDRDVSEVLAALRHTHNLILYGPPGTGRTYVARQAARTFIQTQLTKPLSTAAIRQQAISGLPL